MSIRSDDGWWLRNVRRPGDTVPVNVRIIDGRIAEITSEALERAPLQADDVDGAGALMLPGLIDSHCHVDKTLWGGPWVPHIAGPSVASRIEAEQRVRFKTGYPSVERITGLLEQMVVCGTTHIRTHTDIDPEVKLAGFEAVARATARLGNRIHVEQVAFPQSGVVTRPGTAALLEEAVKQGAAAVGGLDPAGFDQDPVGQLDILFDIAQRHGSRVDIHLHDPGELGRWQVKLVAERTRVLGMAGRVVLSHAFCLAEMPPDTEKAMVEELVSAGIGITTAAVFNRPVPPVRRLHDSNVNVSAGNDGICDLWSPFGNGDMLERAMHVAYRADLRRDEDLAIALNTATRNGAVTLGLEDHGLNVGSRASLVLVEARNVAEAVVARPPRRLVVKDGVITARDGELAGATP